MARLLMSIRLLLCAATVVLIAHTANVSAEPFDAILLLDESGSMRQTDPSDSRIDAAEMFIRLCNDEHRVGLMGFSTGVRALSDLQPMGMGRNREVMVSDLKQVRSDGQWTHIERALRMALDDLQRSGESTKRRAIILMTDGKVDLGEGAGADRESVQNIRGPLVSECLQEGIEIYCVAYSDGVDLQLLQYISSATDGMCVEGKRDDELRRMFLRLFEEMAEPQTIPVRDGNVLIDSSVREATFLILHEGYQGQVRLNRPDGQVLTSQNADADTPWFASDNFDLVTVSRPEAGNWSIVPKGNDGDHRVMVLTDLELQLEDLPPMLKPGADLALLTRLISNSQTVNAPEILSRLVMEGKLTGKESFAFRLRDNGISMDRVASDGWYGVEFSGPSAPGMYDIEIIARAPTLERRIVRHIAIVERWFQAELGHQTVKIGEVVPFKVWVLNRELTNQRGVDINFEAAVMRPDGIRRMMPIDPISSTLYTVGIGDTKTPGAYQVTVTGTMQTPDGAPVRHTLGPFKFHVVGQHNIAVATPDTHHPSQTPEPHHTPESTPAHDTPEPTVVAQHTPETPDTHDTPEESGGSLLMGIISLLMGIIIIGGGVFGFWKYKNAASTVQAETPSMEHLRQRAEEIRNEDYDVADSSSMPTVLEDESLSQPEAEPESADELENLDNLRASDEPPPGEDVEIIPEAEPGSPESLAAESVASILGENEGDESEDLNLSESEADLLNQIMNEDSGEADAGVDAAESETEGNASDTVLNNEQENLLAEIMNESDGGSSEEVAGDTASDLLAELGVDDENESSAGETPTETSDGNESLSSSESDLLAEIMGETGGDESDTETEAPPEETTTQSEDDLLAEIMAETQDSDGGADKATPEIPDESDSKSEQEIIDDILNDIEGMV